MAGFIKDNNGEFHQFTGSGSGLINYSTEEIVIGTWCGKPLYGKIIEVNQQSPENILTGLTANDDVTFFYIKNTYSSDDLSSCFGIGYDEYNQRNLGTPYIIRKDNSAITRVTSGFKGYIYHIFLAYTKITD